MKHNILITGGSGFVGSQVAMEFYEAGHTVTIVDRVYKKHGVKCDMILSDYRDFFVKNKIPYDTVIHLAAEHQVEQSVTEPAKYYTNNVVKMKEMLDCVVELGVKNILFSSSGSVYGNQSSKPLTEDMLYETGHSYASTKIAGEMLIKDYATAYGLNYVNFRYFNAAGADPKCRFGYTQRPATHVIPILCNKILNKQTFTIFGNDYPTPDGTCVRDYVSVADLATAHRLALDFLDAGNKTETFNIGGGVGTSVKQLVDCAARVVGVDPIIEYANRRTGDPAALVADISKAQRLLNWVPKYSIEESVKHAWDWETKFQG